MEKLLRPERLGIDPNSTNASIEWTHWFRTFENFISGVKDIDDTGKLNLLVNYVSPAVFTIFNDSKSYSDAVSKLKSAFVKPRNEIFARHQLATRHQAQNETVDQYFRVLQNLAQNCEFKEVSAQLNKDEHIRDAFITGLHSQDSRRRLLENNTLTLQQAYDQALALEMAQTHSDSYHFNSRPTSFVNSASLVTDKQNTDNLSTETLAASSNQKCYFCGKARHPRYLCPAKECICKACGKQGHFATVCISKTPKVKSKVIAMTGDSDKQQNEIPHCSNIVSAVAPSCLSKSIIEVHVNGVKAKALIDSGSSSSYIDECFAQQIHLTLDPATTNISMASTSMSCVIKHSCNVDLQIKEHTFKNITLSALPDACVDLIIGHDILQEYKNLIIQFNGSKPSLEICNLIAANVPEVNLFQNLMPNCKPVVTKSRRFSSFDQKFIDNEIQQLLKDGIIEVSSSPWRAQIVVVSNDNHKKRMCVDYSQTVNRYTLLDAYPLPRVDDIVNKVAQYSVFSTIDLRSAYHQVPISKKDRPYTAFEANGKLYQFCRIPFGVTNGVPCFQRFIDNIISTENLQGTFAYLDDITICGKTQTEHDYNLQTFLQTAEKYNLTINQKKSKFSTRSINLLGYTISENVIKPDSDRLKPLLDFPVPKDLPALRRVMGMFAHYSKWIPNFSEKIRPLVECKQFPLNKTAAKAFEEVKVLIAKSAVNSIDETLSFEVETDASDQAIGATLSQSGRPVAFFSRTLSQTEQRHSAVEREAYAIVESLRKWKHFLLGKHFRLITDQQSVAFMFHKNHSSKIKNDKILRWRLELSNFQFDIVYRPGRDNAAADALSRICATTWESTPTLTQLHSRLCHPGVTRMYHYIRCKNLPFSINEVREVTRNCAICCEIKPNFTRFEGKLIKATAPFERLNLDFKGPIPSTSRNRYFLTVIDEYSRFPFVFPCSDVSSASVIENLKKLFFLFGTPNYVHSDRGSSFMSAEVKDFLSSNNIATSRTTAYNPQGNGQTERYNGVIWKTIMLTLKTKGLNIDKWEYVVGEALHSIRSLLCTATNETPHERMFKHQRRSSNGSSLPTWLSAPGPVFMRKHANSSKYDPIVEEVTLLEANPNYAYVRLPSGKETTVSLRHLAPRGLKDQDPSTQTLPQGATPEVIQSENGDDVFEPVQPLESQTQEISLESDDNLNEDPMVQNRRPQRIKKLPTYLKDYDLSHSRGGKLI